MASPSYYVYEGDGGSNNPRRPGIDDVGGAAKVEDQDYPPDPEEHLTANDVNQGEQLLVGFSQVVPPILVSIEFSAGTPQIKYFNAINYNLSSSALIASADLVITDNAAGDTTVAITSTLVPARFCDPWGLTVNEDVAIDEMRAIPYAAAGKIGVRVKTKAATVGTDAGFTVCF